jgi:hypothetical protein
VLAGGAVGHGVRSWQRYTSPATFRRWTTRSW